MTNCFFYLFFTCGKMLFGGHCLWCTVGDLLVFYWCLKCFIGWHFRGFVSDKVSILGDVRGLVSFLQRNLVVFLFFFNMKSLQDHKLICSTLFFFFFTWSFVLNWGSSWYQTDIVKFQKSVCITKELQKYTETASTLTTLVMTQAFSFEDKRAKIWKDSAECSDTKHNNNVIYNLYKMHISYCVLDYVGQKCMF